LSVDSAPQPKDSPAVFGPMNMPLPGSASQDNDKLMSAEPSLNAGARGGCRMNRPDSSSERRPDVSMASFAVDWDPPRSDMRDDSPLPRLTISKQFLQQATETSEEASGNQRLFRQVDEVEADVRFASLTHPNGRVRMCLDLASVALLIWDSLSLPYILAWEPKSTGAMLVLAYCAALFWLSDIVLSFCRCYYRKDGSLETRPRAIIAKYVRAWFLPDVLVNITDWLNLVTEFQASNGGAAGSCDSAEF